MTDDTIVSVVKGVVAKNSVKDHAINAFKLAMINFDYGLFHNTYLALCAERSFQQIFKEVFIPLLNELGLLWQTNTIELVHEHFISNLVKQKIYLNLDKLQMISPTRRDKTFVLFLPENEIHEIGLLYLNYEITLKGYKSLYLGQTVPLASLEDFSRSNDNVYFLSYFTVEPSKDKIEKYMQDFQSLLGANNSTQLWILGYQTQYLDIQNHADNISIYHSIDEVVNAI